MDNVKVSVLMPSYNAEKYIGQAIESIIGQTYVNWELIIVDDASTDKTSEIARQYVQLDSRVKVLRLEKNLGGAAARNRAIIEAKGEYIAWQDSDDASLPQRLEHQADFLESHADVGTVGGFLEFFNKRGTLHIRKYAASDAELRRHIFKYQVVAQPGAMTRMVCFREVGMFDENLTVAEDMDMVFRIGTKYKFANLQEIVIRYREHGKSLTFAKLRQLELNVLKIRKKYRHLPSYKFTFSDWLYNILQRAFVYIFPTKLKIKLFDAIRNTAPAELIFICHSYYMPGGQIFDSHWSSTYEFLNHYYGNNYTTIRHSLYNGGQSRIYKRGINGTFTTVPLVGALPDALRYGAEIVVTFFYLLLVSSRRPIQVLAIDPLSCFSAALLKQFGGRVKIIFITPDFAKRRFANSLLNSCYFWMDRFCTGRAEVNYCSSIRVIEYKKQLYGKKIDFSKLRWYPNVPPPWSVEKYSQINKIPFRLIYVGVVSSQLDFANIFRTVQSLTSHYPALHLLVIGDGDQRQILEQIIDRENLKAISMKGQLTFDETMQAVAGAEVGLALYAGNLQYDEFRDSLKIREYQALGVIPIASAVVKANAEEIKKYNSGLVIESSSHAITAALTEIFENNIYKQELMENAQKNYLIYKGRFQELYNTLQSLNK